MDSERSGRKPNIVYILTDQQHHGMMSCAGNTYLKTPAMDRIAATGTRFALGYASNPVCLPTRTAMVTGHYPGRFGIGKNEDGKTTTVPESTLRESMGWVLRRAGYETVYGGKTHWPCNMDYEAIGFDEMLTRDSYEELTERSVEYLRRDHDKPFLLVASFENPHDICLMAIDAYTHAMNLPQRYPHLQAARVNLAEALQIPPGVSREVFFEKLCPPLPENHEIPQDEPPEAGPGPIADFMVWTRDTWTEEDWRMHRWAYCRLTERVDRQIVRILDALHETGLEDDTVIIFSSDHGDMDAAHRVEHKPLFYEEATRVPFIISWKGVTKAGCVDHEHLISPAIDLIPTLCDLAGTAVPAGLPGRSVVTLAEGRDDPSWRAHVVVERQNGRMIRGDRYKYSVYDSAELQEELFDLRNDPGEMRNLAGDLEYTDAKREHREQLRAWVESYDDTIGRAYVPET
jgi:arylsulfatase A-like enzyme